MLRLSGICKRFEDLPVLSNLSLTLSRGEIVALIGPSGCGKTTLLNIISGLTAPDAGTEGTHLHPAGARGEHGPFPQRALPNDAAGFWGRREHQ